MVILCFLFLILILPLSVYQTYVLEEKHSFNKTTPSLFVTGLLQGWAFALVLGAPFLAAFLYAFKWAGDRFVPRLMGFMYAPYQVFSHSTPHDNVFHRITFQLIILSSST